MARARRGSPSSFGPQWLQWRLTELLPAFPDVAVCVAFSGGADSTALLAALSELPRSALALRAVHIDHGLQPQSRRWSAHCRRVARRLQVPFAARTVTVAPARGESLEAAARAARYGLLAAMLAPGEALLTAHHQDDQLETVLLQLFRGAGVAGLAAMPDVAPFASGLLVRPLLPLARAALTEWLLTRGISWVEDESNAHLGRDRNYLRARVLPVVRARWPSAGTTVGRSARHAAEAQRLLEALGEADALGASCGAMLSARMLRRLPPERRRNALRWWLAARGALTPPAARLEEIAGPLLEAREDAQPRVAWQGAAVQRDGDRLSLHLAPRSASGTSQRAHAPAGARGPPRVAARATGHLDLSWDWRRRRALLLPPPFGALTLKADRRGPLDLDALAPRLLLRSRRGGERLRLLRGGPHRALKQLLQEAHVPVRRRAQLPLLFAGEALVAVADLWLDESVQAHASSRRRARLLWHPAE